MFRRRLLMLKSQEKKGYFDGYKTLYETTLTLMNRWSYWDPNQFQIQKLARVAANKTVETSLVNPERIASNTEAFDTSYAIGYDSTKKYELKIRVLSKTIERNVVSDIENSNSSFMFQFKGSEIIKSSQPVNVHDIVCGTEFIIPIEKGEILNNLCVCYISDTLNGEKDFYCVSIMFEFYFEEITE